MLRIVVIGYISFIGLFLLPFFITLGLVKSASLNDLIVLFPFSIACLSTAYFLFYLYRLAAAGSSVGVWTVMLFACLALLVHIVVITTEVVQFWPVLQDWQQFDLVARIVNVTSFDWDQWQQLDPEAAASHYKGLVSTSILVLAGLALGGLPSMIWYSLILSGLITFLRQRKTNNFELFQDRTYDTNFWISKDGVRINFARLMGIFAPSGYGNKASRSILISLLVAFMLEGFGFLMLLSLFQVFINVSNNVEEKLQGKSVAYVILVIMFGLAVTMVLGSMCIFLGRWLRGYAQGKALLSLDEVQCSDPRAPILFLRSFRDDSVSLQRAKPPFLIRLLDPTVVMGSLEHLAMRILDYIGPVVTLGNPTDTYPPQGAARAYDKVGNNWQDTIRSLMIQSRLIIMAPTWSSGVTWEINTIKQYDLLQKTLFLFPPEETTDTLLLESLSNFVHNWEEADTGRGKISSENNATLLHNIGVMFPDGKNQVLLTATRATELEYEVAIRWFASRVEHLNPVQNGVNKGQALTIA